MNSNYDDIINLPHHVSKNHPKMSVLDRAAQFAPFAALTGYDEIIHQTGRYTNSKIVLTQDAKEILDRKFLLLSNIINTQPFVLITYFCPDNLKEGGEYKTYEGNLKKIDSINNTFIFTDGTIISSDNILDIANQMFTE